MSDGYRLADESAQSLRAKLEQLSKTDNQTANTQVEQAPPVSPEPDFIDMNQPDDDGPQDKLPKRRWQLHWPPSKKEARTVIIVLLILVIPVWLLVKPHHKLVAAVTPKPAPVVKKPLLVPDTLSGLPVSPSVNKQAVTAVMVENSLQARPQAGLSQAAVVFEAIAEGGVTRFMGLYQDTAPANVGPIRSARPYYEQWALGFDAAIAHVGGSPEALADFGAWNVKDLNEFSNGSFYHRIASRAAPHNVYTSIADLNQLEAKKGYSSTNFSGFPRKTEQPAKTVTAKTINLTLSGPLYNPSYSYNPATNSYNRSEDGSAQVDANTNGQISPKVVVAMVVPYSLGALDATGAYYSVYNVDTSGPVYIFEDGTVQVGQWSKSAGPLQISFTGQNNKPIKLNPGQTWITAVAKTSDVNYAP